MYSDSISSIAKAYVEESEGFFSLDYGQYRVIFFVHQQRGGGKQIISTPLVNILVKSIADRNYTCFCSKNKSSHIVLIFVWCKDSSLRK